MSKTHWKKLNNPDYLGAYAIEPGQDLVLTIKSAKEETYIGNAGKKEKGLIVQFENSKPMICNATNAKTISKVTGSPYVEDWTGHRIALFATEVSAFGDTVEALRVRPFAPKLQEHICEECGSVVTGTDKINANQVAILSQQKFGRTLCVECAKAVGEKEAE